MRELLNTLYVQTQGAVLHLEHDTVKISVEREMKLRLPLLRLSGIVVFGRVTVTPFLIQRCAEDGRSLVWLDRNGRFKARVEGPARGNVLLRRVQHLALSDSARTLSVARQIVAYSWAMVALSLLLWPVAHTGLAYPIAAVLLGGAFQPAAR